MSRSTAISNSPLRNVQFQADLHERFSGGSLGSNFEHHRIAYFAPALSFTNAPPQNFPTMPRIVGSAEIFKVLQPVVVFDPILVVHRHPVGRTKERQRHQAMNGNVFCYASMGNDPVHVPIRARFRSGDPSRLSVLPAKFAAQSPNVRNRVHAFVAHNRFPEFFHVASVPNKGVL